MHTLSLTLTPLESYTFHSYLINLQPLADDLHLTYLSSLLQQRHRLPLNHLGLIISFVSILTAFLIPALIPHLNLHDHHWHLNISYHEITKSG
jgi:hypothetical protein